jgi:hypothetical protein
MTTEEESSRQVLIKELEEFINKLDLHQMLKEWIYKGFDNYKDYEIYGDAFIPLKQHSNYPLSIPDEEQ